MCVSDFVDVKKFKIKEEGSILKANVPPKYDHEGQGSKESQNLHLEEDSEVFQDKPIDFHKLKPVKR